MKSVILLFLFLSITLCAQEKGYSVNGFYIPRNIEECNVQLDTILEEEAKIFIESTEDMLLNRVLGMMIFSEWYENDSTRLCTYFKDKGILNFEDRDYLILLSYKRYLLKQPFDINKECFLITSYNDSIKSVKREKYNRNITADSINGIYIPLNLEDCLLQLDKILDDSTKTSIKMPQEEMASYHFGIGRWLRSHWNLWSGSRLQQWFEKQGVDHPDNMSGIILSVYQEYLRDKNLDINCLFSDISREIQKEMEHWDILQKEKDETIEFIAPEPSDEYKNFIKTRKIESLFISR